MSLWFVSSLAKIRSDVADETRGLGAVKLEKRMAEKLDSAERTKHISTFLTLPTKSYDR